MLPRARYDILLGAARIGQQCVRSEMRCQCAHRLRHLANRHGEEHKVRRTCRSHIRCRVIDYAQFQSRIDACLTAPDAHNTIHQIRILECQRE